jgi:RimJ/RimL family protein N-acetyltransferase
MTGVAINAELVEWDTLAFGKAVARINLLNVNEPKPNAAIGFFEWLNEQNVSIVSCRLAIDNLVESMWLENLGFRFVEMILHPTLSLPPSIHRDNDEISVAEVTDNELHVIADIARNAFHNERFHADHRLDSSAAGLRYANWVVNSHTDSRQKLVKLVRRNQVIGFFIYTENGREIDWLLTAIAPAIQGQGLGYQAWRRMLAFHQQQGFSQITTSITVKNVAVMNLYRKLDFVFSEPQMTFHLVRP